MIRLVIYEDLCVYVGEVGNSHICVCDSVGGVSPPSLHLWDAKCRGSRTEASFTTTGPIICSIMKCRVFPSCVSESRRWFNRFMCCITPKSLMAGESSDIGPSSSLRREFRREGDIATHSNQRRCVPADRAARVCFSVTRTPHSIIHADNQPPVSFMHRSSACGSVVELIRAY